MRERDVVRSVTACSCSHHYNEVEPALLAHIYQVTATKMRVSLATTFSLSLSLKVFFNDFFFYFLILLCVC